MENMHTEVGFFYWHREKLGGEGGWGVGGLIPFGSGLSYFTISISRMCTVYPRPLRSCLCPWSCLIIGLRNGVIKGSFPYHRDCFESLRLAVKSGFRTTLKFCCMHEDRKLGCERRIAIVPTILPSLTTTAPYGPPCPLNAPSALSTIARDINRSFSSFVGAYVDISSYFYRS